VHKTEEKPTGLEPTYQSSFDDEKRDLLGGNVTPKSLGLKFWDFWRDKVGVGIITAVIMFTVTGHLALPSNVNSQNVKIDTLKDDVKSLKEKADKNNHNDNDLNVDLQVFKAKLEKDIENIKTTLNFSKK
jgi:hypothetical protein